MSRCFLLALLLLIPLKAHCYEVNVHRKIAREAIDSLNMQQYFISSLGFDIQTDKFKADIIYTKNAKDWIESGSDWEDNIIGASAGMRFMNHFYDPTTSMGLNVAGIPVGDAVSSLVWGKNNVNNLFNWSRTRDRYYLALTTTNPTDRSAGFAYVFRSLGQLIHLLHDKAVPAHVRNDGHLPPITNPLLEQTDMYEKYTRDAASGANDYPPLKLDGYAAVDLQTFNTVDRFWSNAGKGLAEFTNANFVSHDTNLDNNKYAQPGAVPEPGIYTETVNDPEAGLINVVVRYARGYITDQYRPVTSPAIRLAAYSYFDFEAGKIAAGPVFSLNRQVHYEYANYLLPRAVGYSAGLLDYFFRDTLDVSWPSDGVYSIADGSKTPYADMHGNRHQQFTKIKVALLNTTPNEAIEAGTLTAVARYKIIPNYAPDLSSYPPDGMTMKAVKEYSYSVSKAQPVASGSIRSDYYNDITFDFSDLPIPAGITDLTLQVVFKGTIGNEADNAIAVGMRDVSEPTHMTIWNLSDMYSILYDTPTYSLYTFGQIESKAAGDWDFMSLLDTDGDRFLDNELYLQPIGTTYKISFWSGWQWSNPATTVVIYPGDHIRMIVLADPKLDNGIGIDFNDAIEPSTIIDPFTGAVNQMAADGIYDITAAHTFRKGYSAEKQMVVPIIQHFSEGTVGCTPQQSRCPYPDETAINVSITPIPFTSVFE